MLCRVIIFALSRHRHHMFLQSKGTSFVNRGNELQSGGTSCANRGNELQYSGTSCVN